MTNAIEIINLHNFWIMKYDISNSTKIGNMYFRKDDTYIHTNILIQKDRISKYMEVYIKI